MLLPVEGVVVVLLHSGLHDGFDDVFLLLVLETSLILLSLCTPFCQLICPFISWDAAMGRHPLEGHLFVPADFL